MKSQHSGEERDGSQSDVKSGFQSDSMGAIRRVAPHLGADVVILGTLRAR